MRTLKDVAEPDPRWTVTAFGISVRICPASEAHSSWMMPMPLRGSQKASTGKPEGSIAPAKQKTPVSRGLLTFLLPFGLEVGDDDALGSGRVTDAVADNPRSRDVRQTLGPIVPATEGEGEAAVRVLDGHLFATTRGRSGRDARHDDVTFAATSDTIEIFTSRASRPAVVFDDIDTMEATDNTITDDGGVTDGEILGDSRVLQKLAESTRGQENRATIVGEVGLGQLRGDTSDGEAIEVCLDPGVGDTSVVGDSRLGKDGIEQGLHSSVSHRSDEHAAKHVEADGGDFGVGERCGNILVLVERDGDVMGDGIRGDEASRAVVGQSLESVGVAGVDDLTLFSDIGAEIGRDDFVERGKHRDERAESFRGDELWCQTLIENGVAHLGIGMVRGGLKII